MALWSLLRTYTSGKSLDTMHVSFFQLFVCWQANWLYVGSPEHNMDGL